MSILIKGMDMPTCCAKCQWFQQHFPEGKGWCKLTNRLVHETWASANLNPIPDNCPLAPVPTPHGDLIEREMMHELVNWATSKAPFSRKKVQMMIDTAPTIIEAEGEEE